jgi:L-alanine-DL-glutamate epimerase-like enolase superfamily enzyme
VNGAPALITALGVYDATPPDAAAISWSELSPPVRPEQLLVVVEIERDAERAVGIAAATRYLSSAERLPVAEPAAAALAAHLGQVPVPWVAAGGPPRNRYEPSAPGLDVLIELASLDAAGRLTGLPVTAFLGGAARADVPAYASLPSFTDPSEAVACAGAAVEAGFTAIKFHAAGDATVDEATILLSRARLGGSVDLLWDGSCAYDLYDALRVGKALDGAGFLWFEGPLSDDAGPVLDQLARQLRIPLLPDATATHRSPGDWVRDLATGRWDGLRLDVTRVRRVVEAVQLVRAAEAHGMPCEIQSFGYGLAQIANLTLMLTSQACRYFEAPFPSGDLADGLVEPLRPVHGRVSLPEPVGLGHRLSLPTVAARCQAIAETGLEHL